MTFQLIRNISSPDLSVTPTILSGSNPLSKPFGFLGHFLTAFMPGFFISLLLQYSISKAWIKSGQSRFSSGSHVLSSSGKLNHFSRYSVLPPLPSWSKFAVNYHFHQFPYLDFWITLLSSTLSTENSSSACSISVGSISWMVFFWKMGDFMKHLLTRVTVQALTQDWQQLFTFLTLQLQPPDPS